MDGTGKLFADFVRALPDEFETETVSYPTNVSLSYAKLTPIIQSAIPINVPFVLVAESFSTPLAIQFAATNPPNLKGLVLCAGFVTSPVRGCLRFIGSFLAPILFNLALPKLAANFLLVGPDAPAALLAVVRAAISTVQPNVLSARLRAIFACDTRDELSHVAVPILYIQAKQDRLVHASCLDEILQIVPQTTVAAITGPHLLFQREPEQTAEVVALFVQQLV